MLQVFEVNLYLPRTSLTNVNGFIRISGNIKTPAIFGTDSWKDE